MKVKYKGYPVRVPFVFDVKNNLVSFVYTFESFVVKKVFNHEGHKGWHKGLKDLDIQYK